MRRLSSLKSQSFSPYTLHPVLQAMLGNLDVELDEELARYRRQNSRRGGQTNLPRQSPPSPRAEPLTPTPVVETSMPIPASTRAGRQPSPTAVEADIPPVPSYHQTDYGAAGLSTVGVPLAIASDVEPVPFPLVTLSVPPQTDDELTHASAVSPAPVDPEAEAEDVWGPDAYLESSEHLLQTLADEETEPRTSQESGMLQSLLTPLGIGSMLLLLLSSVTFGYLLMNPSSMSFWGLGTNQQTPTPDLATGSAGAGTVGAPSSLTGQDLSPNLSAQEFPDVNLNTLSTLPKTSASDSTTPPLTGVSQSGTDPSVAARSSPEVDVRSAAAAQAIASAPTATNSTPNSPRSSQPTASNLPPSPRTSSSTSRSTTISSQRTRARGSTGTASATRSASGSATASPRPPASSTTNGRSPSRSPSTPAAAPSRVTAQPSQPRPRPAAPTVATAPRTPTVAPPSPTSAANSTAPSTAAPVYYYVVMDFSGDRSLEQARQVVGDAFLRNFSDGAKIQFGRFVDRERAATLARELQSQGVSARVYQP